MSQNIDLLTVLFAVCYFIVKGRTDVVFSTLNRDVDGDYFTDVCGNCYKYGAVKTQRVCKCRSENLVFLRNEGRCKSENVLLNLKEKCLSWHKLVEVIDPEKEAKYYFNQVYSKYESCRLKPLISFRNSSTGKWHLVNLTGNQFLILNSQVHSSIQVKVSQKSPNLTMFKGYIMKLRLNCTKHPMLSSSNKTRTEDSCLLFKVKGKVQFPLACPSTVSSPSTTSTPTKQSTTTGTPITPSTTTSTPTITTTSTPTITTTKPITTPDQAINAAIVVIGIILCLLLIGVFAYLLHQYTILCPCRRRGHQIGGGIMNSNVINNLGQPTFRIQEEPVYAEVADVYPLENKAKGKVTVHLDENPSVVLNLYAQEVGFSRGRLNPDSPLSRSNLEGIRRTSDESRNVRERDRSLQEEETDGSLVFRNLQFEETSFSSLPRREQDLKKLTESREQGDRGICNYHENHSHHSRNEHLDRHDHHDCNEHLDHNDGHCLHSPKCQETGDNVLYEGLIDRTRIRSKFICPSCNDSSDYQRPNTIGCCPHREKENNTREKTRSFYESLAPEVGTRESDYATPSAMEHNNSSSQDGKELPEYNILEPEESEQELRPDEPVNHEYNILEPETPSDDVQSDMNETFPNSGSTDEEKDLPIHPSEIKSLENNPVYAFHWKMKNDEPCARRRARSM